MQVPVATLRSIKNVLETAFGPTALHSHTRYSYFDQETSLIYRQIKGQNLIYCAFCLLSYAWLYQGITAALWHNKQVSLQPLLLWRSSWKPISWRTALWSTGRPPTASRALGGWLTGFAEPSPPHTPAPAGCKMVVLKSLHTMMLHYLNNCWIIWTTSFQITGLACRLSQHGPAPCCGAAPGA